MDQTQQTNNTATASESIWDDVFGINADSGDDSTNFSVGLDEESGEMRVTVPERKQPVEQRLLDESGEAQGANQATPPPDERVARLEGTVNQLINVITGMAGYIQGQGQISNNLNGQQQPQYDLQDPQQLSAFISETVNRAVQASLQPVMQTLPQLTSRLSMQEARSMYGKDFATMLEPVKAVMESDANLTFDQAFKIVQTVKTKLNGTSANSHSTPKQPQRPTQGSANDLIARSQRLADDRGIINPAPAKPVIKGLGDALEQAIIELTRGAS